MKFSTLLVALAFACAGCRPSGPAAPKGSLAWTSLRFADGRSIQVEVADTAPSRNYGLMNRAQLAADYGMLFIFPDEQPLQFWMKNTLVDLDMVFIGKDRRISAIAKNVPRSAPDTPDANLARRNGFGQYVLELPAGASDRYKLAEGQALAFQLP